MASPRPFDWTRPATLAAFGAALRRAREEAALTMDQLAQRTGISKPYISNIETARAPGPPSEEKLEKLAQALNLPAGVLSAGADWLRTPPSVRQALMQAEGRHPRAEAGAFPRRADGSLDLDRMMGHKEARDASPDAEAKGAAARRATERGEPAMIPLRQVPVINRVAAGSAKEFTDLSYPAGVADGYVAAPDLPDAPVAAAFAVRISGDSMMPEYGEGELVIVGPSEAKDGDDCVVRLGEAEDFATTFKRVFFERDALGNATAVRLVPLNPVHAERRVMVEEVTGIYPLMYRLVPGRTEKSAKPKPSERLW